MRHAAEDSYFGFKEPQALGVAGMQVTVSRWTLLCMKGADIGTFRAVRVRWDKNVTDSWAGTEALEKNRSSAAGEGFTEQTVEHRGDLPIPGWEVGSV